VVGVPLVLLGAGHMKLDGPAALDRGRRRHPDVHFDYGRALAIHPLVLDVAAARVPRDADAVVVVGRGSSDPDANADLFKIGRLLVALVLERYREALAGDARMNCDGCKYRLAAAAELHVHHTH